MAIRADEITAVIKDQIAHFQQQSQAVSVGTVIEVGDGIAQVYGLQGVMNSELVEFPTGVRGGDLEQKPFGHVREGEPGFEGHSQSGEALGVRGGDVDPLVADAALELGRGSACRCPAVVEQDDAARQTESDARQSSAAQSAPQS